MGGAAGGRTGVRFAGGFLLLSSAVAGIVTGVFNKIGERVYDRWVDGCVNGESWPVCGTILAWEGLTPKFVASNTVEAVPTGAAPADGGPREAATRAGGVPGAFPQASLRTLTEQDVAGKSCPTLRIMRNEIYARYGHTFRTATMRQYFVEQTWYVDKGLSADGLLTPIEQDNVKLIRQAELRRECDA